MIFGGLKNLFTHNSWLQFQVYGRAAVQCWLAGCPVQGCQTCLHDTLPCVMNEQVGLVCRCTLAHHKAQVCVRVSLVLQLGVWPVCCPGRLGSHPPVCWLRPGAAGQPMVAGLEWGGRGQQSATAARTVLQWAVVSPGPACSDQPSPCSSTPE